VGGAVGLGPQPEQVQAVAEVLRRAAGAAARALAGTGSALVVLPLMENGAADAGRIRALAEGALLGAYRFAGYKTQPDQQRRDPVRAVTLQVPDAADKAARAETRRATTVARAVT